MFYTILVVLLLHGITIRFGSESCIHCNRVDEVDKVGLDGISLVLQKKKTCVAVFFVGPLIFSLYLGINKGFGGVSPMRIMSWNISMSWSRRGESVAV